MTTGANPASPGLATGPSSHAGVSFWILAGVASLLRVAYVAGAARWLKPDAFSEFGAGLALFFILAIAVSGIASAYTRQTSLERGRGLSAASGFATPRRSIALGVLIAAFAGAPGIAAVLGFDSPATPAIAVACAMLLVPLELRRATLRGREEYTRLGWNLLLEATARLAAMPLLLGVAPASAVALSGFLVGELIALASVGRAARRERASGTVVIRFDLLTAKFLALAVVAALFQNLDILLAKRVLAPADAGRYAAAAILAKSLGLLYLPFGAAALPTFTRAELHGRIPMAELRATSVSFSLLALPVLLVFVLAPNATMRVIYGSEYGEIGYVLTATGIGLWLTLLGTLVTLVFAAKDQFGFLFAYTVCMLVEAAALTRADSLSDLSIIVVTVPAVTLAILLLLLYRSARLSNE